ncbi:hypothetical protein DFH09DRAFT_1167324, partial [Mycena vulgaris]
LLSRCGLLLRLPATFDCAAHAEGYLPVHKNSMEFLDAWLVEYQKEVHPKDLARGLLHDLLSNARSISETPVEKERTGRSMFPMGFFSQ